MRKFVVPLALAGVVIGGSGAAAWAQATTTTTSPSSSSAAPDELSVPLADVPPWVLHTARQALAGVELTAAQLDTAGPEAIFELQGTVGGIAAEVDVRPDGSLEEIELVIATEAVPDDVQALFNDAFPDFDLVKVEISERTERNGVISTWYEFDGVTADGRAVDVEVNAAATAYLVEPD